MENNIEIGKIVIYGINIYQYIGKTIEYEASIGGNEELYKLVANNHLESNELIFGDIYDLFILDIKYYKLLEKYFEDSKNNKLEKIENSNIELSKNKGEIVINEDLELCYFIDYIKGKYNYLKLNSDIFISESGFIPLESYFGKDYKQIKKKWLSNSFNKEILLQRGLYYLSNLNELYETKDSNVILKVTYRKELSNKLKENIKSEIESIYMSNGNIENIKVEYIKDNNINKF